MAKVESLWFSDSDVLEDEVIVPKVSNLKPSKVYPLKVVRKELASVKDMDDSSSSKDSGDSNADDKHQLKVSNSLADEWKSKRDYSQ